MMSNSICWNPQEAFNFTVNATSHPNPERHQVLEAIRARLGQGLGSLVISAACQAANEDHNLYTFDMRNLKSAICVHHDFVSAVIDVDYAPTGHSTEQRISLSSE